MTIDIAITTTTITTTTTTTTTTITTTTTTTTIITIISISTILYTVATFIHSYFKNSSWLARTQPRPINSERRK